MEKMGDVRQKLVEADNNNAKQGKNVITLSNNWFIQEKSFNPADFRHIETIFTLGNGYFGTRGTFEEIFPGEERSTFIHGVFDDVPVVFTELANAPDWLELEIFLSGERFSLDCGQILGYERTLNLREATLKREVRWQSPKGHTTCLVFERFASLSDEHLAGIRVSFTPEDYEGTIEVRAGLNVAADNLGLKHWKGITQGLSRQNGWLYCQTRATQIGLAAAFSLKMAAPEKVRYRRWDVLGHPTLSVVGYARTGQTVIVNKWVTYWTTRDCKNPLNQIKRQFGALARLDWESAHGAHCRAWQQEWERCDVIIEGDPEAQLAVRFNIFQLLEAAPRKDERVSIGAKTLSGYGYRGHAFWDTEIFILPLFTLTRPEIARHLLFYRWHTLPGARRKAAANGYQGAQFAWESAATGDEVTPPWVPHYADPKKMVRIWTGDIEIHISADIAYAICQYWQVTGDDEYMRRCGAEIILDTARFWASRAEWNPEKGYFQISDIIGPDEYHEHVDNNAYTNVLVQWHLKTALYLNNWLDTQYSSSTTLADDPRSRLNLKASDLELWQRISQFIYIPYDPKSKLIEQFEGYFERKPIDMAALEPRDKSIQSLFGIEATNQTQALKQPDVLMMLYLFPDLFDEETLRSNYAYYTPRTDNSYGSSLGPSIQTIMACKIGDLSAAYDYFMHTARADLFDVRGNAGDGIHAASAGGLWQAVVFGFAGLSIDAQGWKTSPRLPAHWKRLQFKFFYHGEAILIDLTNP